MKIKELIRFQSWVHHALGLFSHDFNGQIVIGWYWFALAQRCWFVLTTINWFYQSRRFQEQQHEGGVFFFLLVLVLVLSQTGFYLASAQTKGICELSKLEKVERVLRKEIDHDFAFVLFGAFVFPMAHLAHQIYYLATEDDKWLRISYFSSRVLPQMSIQVGMTYYCSILRVIGEQLTALSESKAGKIQTVAIHSYLVDLAQSVHNSSRWMLLSGIINLVCFPLAASLPLTSHIEECLTTTQCCSRMTTILSSTAVNVWMLYCITSVCFRVKNQAKQCVVDLWDLEMKKRSGEQSDIRLSTYFLNVPEFDTSVVDFFDPSPSLFIKVIGETMYIYLLMLQLNVTHFDHFI